MVSPSTGTKSGSAPGSIEAELNAASEPSTKATTPGMAKAAAVSIASTLAGARVQGTKAAYSWPATWMSSWYVVWPEACCLASTFGRGMEPGWSAGSSVSKVWVPVEQPFSSISTVLALLSAADTSPPLRPSRPR